MAIAYNTNIVRSGLVLNLDPANMIKHGVSPYANLAGAGSITNQNFTVVDNTFRTNTNPTTGAGTSTMPMTGLTLNTGSFTLINWLKLTSNPDVGVNNNWRVVFGQGVAQSPFGFYMEQDRFVQFSLTTTLRQYRHINGVFGQFALPLNTWAMTTFLYDKTTGVGSSYLNGVVVNQGFMTVTGDTAGVTSVAGEGILDITTGMSMNLTNSNNTSDPSGAGCFPGDYGPCIIYNRALSAAEVKQNFEAQRGRFRI